MHICVVLLLQAMRTCKYKLKRIFFRVREPRLVHTIAGAARQPERSQAYAWPDQGNAKLLPWVLIYIIIYYFHLLYLTNRSLRWLNHRLLNLPITIYVIVCIFNVTCCTWNHITQLVLLIKIQNTSILAHWVVRRCIML